MTNFDISPIGNFLMYRKGYNPAMVQSLIKENNLCGLRIFDHLDRDIVDNLDFLKDCHFLEGLEIATVKDYRYDFLKFLPNLKHLNIQSIGKHVIDLSQQASLHKLSLQWRSTIKGLECCQNLEKISLIDYREVDLSSIKVLNNLREIVIKTAAIRNLSGLESLKFLEQVTLGNCRYLLSLSALNGLSSLKSLEINSCPKIKDYDTLDNLGNLEILIINDCKKINSIKFMKNFPSLKKVMLLGNTDVLDGDFKPIDNIDEVYCSSRSHYNARLDNIKYDSVVRKNIEKIKKLI